MVIVGLLWLTNPSRASAKIAVALVGRDQITTRVANPLSVPFASVVVLILEPLRQGLTIISQQPCKMKNARGLFSTIDDSHSWIFRFEIGLFTAENLVATG